jgi:hypothetical protein
LSLFGHRDSDSGTCISSGSAGCSIYYLGIGAPGFTRGTSISGSICCIYIAIPVYSSSATVKDDNRPEDDRPIHKSTIRRVGRRGSNICKRRHIRCAVEAYNARLLRTSKDYAISGSPFAGSTVGSISGTNSNHDGLTVQYIFLVSGTDIEGFDSGDSSCTSGCSSIIERLLRRIIERPIRPIITSSISGDSNSVSACSFSSSGKHSNIKDKDGSLIRRHITINSSIRFASFIDIHWNVE